jgi:hypothetical protein
LMLMTMPDSQVTTPEAREFLQLRRTVELKKLRRMIAEEEEKAQQVQAVEELRKEALTQAKSGAAPAGAATHVDVDVDQEDVENDDHENGDAWRDEEEAGGEISATGDLCGRVDEAGDVDVDADNLADSDEQGGTPRPDPMVVGRGWGMAVVARPSQAVGARPSQAVGAGPWQAQSLRAPG